MSNKVKDLDMKNRTYYFFNDIINIKKIDSNNIKIAEKSSKDILIYYIGYVMTKDLKFCKNYLCKSFIPYFSQSKWIL